MNGTADWAGVERDVVDRIRALAAIDRSLDAPPDCRRSYPQDLVVPAARLLAEFCACVQIEDDESEAG